MKAHSLKWAAVAFALCAVVMVFAFVPDVGLFSPHGLHVEASTFTAVALATLRTDLGALESRAAAKIAELKDGLPDVEARKIEDDHKKILDDIAAKKREIEAAETAEREAQQRSQPVGWTPEQVKKITARAAGFGLGADVALDLMGDASLRSIEAITDSLQERAVALRGTTPRQQPQVRMVADEVDKTRAAVGNAVMLRANPQAIVGSNQANLDLIAAAREWRGMSLMEMGRIFLEQTHGMKLRNLSRMELATVLLGMDTMGRAAGQLSTSDFANILANVANKRLRDAYAAAPSLWKQLARQSNAPDFKQKAVTQLSSAPAFKPVKEGAEFTYGALTDGVEKYALATYGRIIPITRQAIINDDMSAFDRLPMMLGRQAGELEASTFWAIFTGNPNMGDGVALFHATHGNLLTGSAIDTDNLSLMRAGMRKQKSLAAKAVDAEPLNLTMKFIVVSPDKETEAAKAVTAVLATQTSQVNVFANSLTIIPEARLSGNAWFGVADPGLIDTIEYAYLDGEEGLYTEQRIGFEVDGIEIKGRLDFAAKAIDWRGMAKNPGN
jgi:hypothetical protein